MTEPFASKAAAGHRLPVSLISQTAVKRHLDSVFVVACESDFCHQAERKAESHKQKK